MYAPLTAYRTSSRIIAAPTGRLPASLTPLVRLSRLHPLQTASTILRVTGLPVEKHPYVDVYLEFQHRHRPHQPCAECSAEKKLEHSQTTKKPRNHTVPRFFHLANALNIELRQVRASCCLNRLESKIGCDILILRPFPKLYKIFYKKSVPDSFATCGRRPFNLKFPFLLRESKLHNSGTDTKEREL